MASGFFSILHFVDKLGKWGLGGNAFECHQTAEELVSEEKHLDVFKIIINRFPASPALLMFNYCVVVCSP